MTIAICVHVHCTTNARLYTAANSNSKPATQNLRFSRLPASNCNHTICNVSTAAAFAANNSSSNMYSNQRLQRTYERLAWNHRNYQLEKEYGANSAVNCPHILFDHFTYLHTHEPFIHGLAVCWLLCWSHLACVCTLRNSKYEKSNNFRNSSKAAKENQKKTASTTITQKEKKTKKKQQKMPTPCTVTWLFPFQSNNNNNVRK